MARPQTWGQWFGNVRDALLGRASIDFGDIAERGLFGITFGVPGAQTWDFAKRFITGQSLAGDSARLTEPYRQHPIVATALQTVTSDAASVEWQLLQRQQDGSLGDEPITSHPVLDVFANPNPYMNGRQLWIGSYLSYWLWGEAIWYYPELVIGGPQVPAVLENTSVLGGAVNCLDPRTVIVDIDKQGEIRYAQKLPNSGIETPLDGSRLTMFKRWNPYNPLRGLPVLASVIAELEGDFAAAQWNDRFFSEQNGIPSGLLLPGKMDADWTQKQKDDLLRRFNQKHGGTKRSVGLLPAGWDWKDLGITQRDMDYRSLREYARETILGVIGVPPFRAGVLDKANYANAREQDSVYWNGTINRFLSSFAATINDDFFQKVDVQNVELVSDWATVKALLEDTKEKAETAKILFSMGIPMEMINERLELGFDLEGVEGADVGWLPVGLVPAGLDVQSEASLPPEDSGDEESAGAASEEEEEQTEKQTPEQIEEQRTMRWRAIISLTTDLERTFDRKIRTHFKQIESEVLSNVEGLKGYVAVHKRDLSQSDINRLLPNKEKIDKRIRRMTAPVYRDTMNRGNESIAAELGAAKAEFDETPAVQSTLTTLTRKIVGVNRTVEKNLRISLLQGIADGETEAELGKRVRDTMKVERHRSRTIARTEVGRAFATARLISMKQANIKRHQWLSSRDSDVRDTHKREDGNIVVIGQKFPVTRLRQPLDLNGKASEIINCRCIATPVVRRSR